MQQGKKCINFDAAIESSGKQNMTLKHLIYCFPDILSLFKELLVQMVPTDRSAACGNWDPRPWMPFTGQEDMDWKNYLDIHVTNLQSRNLHWLRSS